MRPSDLAAVARIRDELRSGAARKARTAAGVSASEVARVLKVSRSSVSDWETGKRTPDASHALAYGRALAALAPEVA
jgi:DNA-binding transcriptional regulator YiaG